MIPVKHIDPDDLALYAMQLLPPDETEEMSLHLQHSSEARRVLSEIYSDLSIFAHSAEMQSPPALARQRLMKHVAREKKAIPIDRFAPVAGTYAPRDTASLLDDEPVRKSGGARILPWVGWAIAAGLGLFSVNLYNQQDQLKSSLASNNRQLLQTQTQAQAATMVMETLKDESAVHFTMVTSDKTPPPPQGRITYVADKGALLLTASNLANLPSDKIYELWLIPADPQGVPIPAGTFKPDSRGYASVVLPDLPKGIKASTFGITIENGEGSQVPTFPIILKGVNG